MNPLRIALAGSILCLPVIATAQPSARRPDIVLTGPSTGELATATRQQVDQFARERGLGLHDLGDQPPPASTSAAQLKAGITDYHGFRYKEAIARFDRLITELASSGGRGLDQSQLADVFIYRAMSKGELGTAADARSDLLRAASLFPAYKLDEARFRPSLIAAFERARASTRSDPDAVVTIATPSGCAIIIDARRIATKQISLRPGVHYIQIECTGSQPFASTQTFVAGAQRFEPTLTARPDDRSRVLKSGERPEIIWVALSRSSRGSVNISLLDRQEAKSSRSYSLRVTSSKDRRVSEQLASIIDTEFKAPRPPPEIIIKKAPRRWFEEPWLWAAVGATTASAIILPFVFRDTSATGFDASITGLP